MIASLGALDDEVGQRLLGGREAAAGTKYSRITIKASPESGRAWGSLGPREAIVFAFGRRLRGLRGSSGTAPNTQDGDASGAGALRLVEPMAMVDSGCLGSAGQVAEECEWGHRGRMRHRSATWGKQRFLPFNARLGAPARGQRAAP